MRVEGEVGGSILKQKEGRRAGQRAQASGEVAHGTARRIVAVARRAAILGVRAGRWRRVERPRSFGRSQGWGAARAWRVAGGERRRHGVTVKTEREERERWSEDKLVNNSKF